MSDFASEVQRPPSGCGIQGCLFGAVALFVLLLIGLLIIAFFRFQEPPQGIPRPISTVDYVIPALGAAGTGARPATDSREPTTREERMGEVHA